MPVEAVKMVWGLLSQRGTDCFQGIDDALQTTIKSSLTQRASLLAIPKRAGGKRQTKGFSFRGKCCLNERTFTGEHHSVGLRTTVNGNFNCHRFPEQWSFTEIVLVPGNVLKF